MDEAKEAVRRLAKVGRKRRITQCKFCGHYHLEKI